MSEGTPQVVYKYEVRPEGQLVNMPKGAQLLRVGQQHQGVYVWALVDPHAPVVARMIAVLPTGHIFESENETYIDTVFMVGGLVFHLFDMGEK